MEYQHYLASYRGYFWNWEDDADVIAIEGGSTVAYREKLVQVLSALSEQGLPPFGALLLALVATNHSMGNDLDHIQQLMFRKLSGDGEVPGDKMEIEDAVKMMRVLQQVPQRYSSGDKRILLLQALFQGCHNINSIKVSKYIVRDFVRQWATNKNELVQLLERPKEFSINNFRKDFRCMALLYKKFPDVNTLLQKLKGLPELGEILPEAEEKLPTGGKRDFVDDLLDNQDTFHVGALIRHIWSGLKIPLHHNLAGDQPLGGVSDLTNKGDFDKLLVSEFANDDLTFASRLANNEVLYLRREIPPVDDKLERVLLIDATIKTWGTPKMLAHAVAVAITRHPKTEIQANVFVVGKDYRPVSYHTIDEVIDAQQWLDGSLHAAEGLEKFLKEYKFTGTPEIFFISTAATTKHAAMQKIMAQYWSHFKYWVQVDPEGKIDLYRNQRNSKKLLQEMKLPLEQLWQNEKRAKKPEPEQNVRVAHNYPILFPAQLYNSGVLLMDDGELLIVSSQKKVFRTINWNTIKNNKGIELVRYQLPKGYTDFEVGKNSQGEILLLCLKPQAKEISIVNLSTSEIKTTVVPGWRPSKREIFFDQGTFYCLDAYNCCLAIEHEPEMKAVKVDNYYLEARKVYQERQKKLKELQWQYSSETVLRNVEQIYVNRNLNLVINKHELKINEQGFIKLAVAGTGDRRSLVSAQRIDGSDVFEFPNGFRVEIDKSGMMVLVAGSGVKDVYTLTLKDPGPNKLRMVKELMGLMSMSLPEAKMLVDGAPSVISKNLSFEEADRIGLELSQQNATLTTKLTEEIPTVYIPLSLDVSLGMATDKVFAGKEYYYHPQKPLKMINTRVFYNDYIKTYIDAIVKHGA